MTPMRAFSDAVRARALRRVALLPASWRPVPGTVIVGGEVPQLRVIQEPPADLVAARKERHRQAKEVTKHMKPFREGPDDA